MPLLTYPCLPIPLSKVGTVIGMGSGRTQLLHILPRTLEYRLSEVNWVVQLCSFQSSIPSRDSLPLELLHQVLPPQ